MIPKIIHYCWFGKGIMPASHKKCIRKWKKILPDYQIVRWDERNFNVNICSYTRKAYENKKYAFVSDVARLYALNSIGGIYLDTDVELYHSLNNYLSHDFFSAIELYHEFYNESCLLIDKNGIPFQTNADVPHLEIMTSIIGAKKNNKLINDLLGFYMGLDVDDEFAANFRKHVNFDRLVARFATQYGFRYKDETQYLSDNMVIYSTGIFGHAFCVNPEYKVSYHYNAASWESKSKKQELMLQLDRFNLLGIYNKLRRIKKMIIKP